MLMVEKSHMSYSNKPDAMMQSLESQFKQKKAMQPENVEDLEAIDDVDDIALDLRTTEAEDIISQLSNMMQSNA